MENKKVYKIKYNSPKEAEIGRLIIQKNKKLAKIDNKKNNKVLVKNDYSGYINGVYLAFIIIFCTLVLGFIAYIIVRGM